MPFPDGSFLYFLFCLLITKNSGFTTLYIRIVTKFKFYNHRCIMALIRGLNSHAPCPVCLVPGDQLTDLSTAFELRTKEKMMDHYQRAQGVNIAEGDAILKTVGLRNVEVIC